MAGTQEREELHRLVDDLTDEQVRDVLAAARQLGGDPVRSPVAADYGLAWIAVIKDGPEDLAERTKSILRNELGQRRGPAA